MVAPVSVFVTCFIILGWTNMPSFAIQHIAVAICNGVIPNLWPNEEVASSTGPTSSKSQKFPLTSPEVKLVESNKPKASKYLYSVLAPIFSPNSINAGLQELHKASLKLCLPWPGIPFQQ